MISVFTPTYNRAYILPALYQSLQRQTCRNFEWIIVDDGSTDNTSELIASWQKDHNDFTIIYRKQQNGGKHTAINYGVALASYKWFFIVDSDDYLRDDAIERIWVSRCGICLRRFAA
ncbi:MAG: glycosyltransferase family 2 protein [Clostridia bacterium]|nr:glycosyltransferase family 2 protein [Clostridia bacterium]